MSVLDYIPPQGIAWRTDLPPDPTHSVLMLCVCKSPLSKYSLKCGIYSDGQFWPDGEEAATKVAYWALPPDTAPDGGKII